VSNQATLKLVGTSDLSAIARDLKNIATEGKSAGPALASLNKSLDQSAKSATTFGQKIKSFGSTFSSSIASIGTLGGTVLNLSRQYQDLSDSQIRVDKTRLKLSKSTEAVGVAQGKLNELTKKGITSGAEYEKATLDVQQALEQQDIAARNLQEAQEDQQRAQENFWVGLVPTVTSAGATVVSVLNDIGGTKGLGGLADKIKGLVGTGGGGLGGLIGKLTGSGGLTGSLDSAKTAATGFGGALASMAVGAAAGIAGALLIIQQVQQAQDALEAQGIRMAKTNFGGQLFSPTEMKFSFNQLNEIMEKTHLSILQIENDAEGTKKAWVDAGGKVDEAGNIIFSTANTLSDLGEKFKVGSAEYIKYSVNLLKAGKSVADVTKYLTDSGISAYDTQRILTAATKEYQTSLETTTPAQTSFKSAIDTTIPSMNTMGGTFATITKNIGPATTGIAGLNSQMNPFNTTLLTTGTNATAAGQGLQAMGQAAQKSASLALQASQAAARAAQNMANAANMAKVVAQGGVFGHGGGMDFGGGTVTRKGNGITFGPTHPFLGRAANPNFQLRPDYQKAKIIKKAASGMHETVTQPTWILAGEAGKERVDIGGGGTPIVNVFVDGVQRPARYSIGTRK